MDTRYNHPIVVGNGTLCVPFFCFGDRYGLDMLWENLITRGLRHGKRIAFYADDGRLL